MSARYEPTGRTRLRVKRSWWRNLLVVQVEVDHSMRGDPWWRDACLEDFGLPDIDGIVRDSPAIRPPNQGSGGHRPIRRPPPPIREDEL